MKGLKAQSRQSAKLFSTRPQPLTGTAGECAPLPVLGGGTHSLSREVLGLESQFCRGNIHCGTVDQEGKERGKE